jgi:hypothetical protein
MPVKKGIAVKTLKEKSKIEAWQSGAINTATATDHTPERDRNMAPTIIAAPVIAANSALDSGSCVQSLKGANTMNEHTTPVWVMASLRKHFEVVKDDLIARYLLLTHRHDGTGAIQVKFTPVRVVCQNTLNQALSEGPSFRVAHTKSMHARLKKASDGLAAVLAQSRKVEKLSLPPLHRPETI